jgi:hypothetical protein
MESAHDADTIQPHQNDVPSKVKLVIRHQFPNIELISPAYIGKYVTCHLPPDQRVNVGSTMQAYFNIDLTRHEPIGVLMYRLQRKNVKPSNKDVMSNEEESTCIQLFIIWKVNRSKEFWVASYLIEYDKSHVLDKNGLVKLAKGCRVFNIQDVPVEDTWLIHDNAVLMTRMSVAREKAYYKLNMTISETSTNDDTQRLRYIDVNK